MKADRHQFFLLIVNLSPFIPRDSLNSFRICVDTATMQTAFSCNFLQGLNAGKDNIYFYKYIYVCIFVHTAVCSIGFLMHIYAT